MSGALLEIEGLTRTYPSRRGPPVRALDGIALRLDHGEILGIVGASGCGKSTLARLVAALDRATAGRISIGGTAYDSLPERALRPIRRRVQMVFQDPFGSLDPRWRVGRTVAEPLHLLPSLGRSKRTARVDEALGRVGLPADAAHRFPHEFSGGQRQRIAIARAIVTGPDLVVADEAVSALDLSVQAQILNLFLDLRDSGTSVLFISHDLSAVGAIADRIAVMDRGTIVEVGPSESLLTDPQHPVTQALLAARL